MSKGFQKHTKKHPQRFQLYIPIDYQLVVEEAKKIADREGESLSQKFCRYCSEYVRVHGDGNPQLLMANFVDSQLLEKKKCDFPRCDKDAVCIGYPKPPGNPKVYLCEAHKQHALQNGLLKSFKPLKK